MEFLVQNYNFLWLTIALISGYALFSPMLRGNPDDVSPQQAVLLINRQDALVVDVREQAEFAEGHLPAARNVPVKEIEARAADLKKFFKRPLIVVCQHGDRSRRALEAFRKAGFTQVFSLAGGLKGWQGAGQPVTREAQKEVAKA